MRESESAKVRKCLVAVRPCLRPSPSLTHLHTRTSPSICTLPTAHCTLAPCIAVHGIRTYAKPRAVMAKSANACSFSGFQGRCPVPAALPFLRPESLSPIPHLCCSLCSPARRQLRGVVACATRMCKSRGSAPGRSPARRSRTERPRSCEMQPPFPRSRSAAAAAAPAPAPAPMPMHRRISASAHRPPAATATSKLLLLPGAPVPSSPSLHSGKKVRAWRLFHTHTPIARPPVRQDIG